MVSADQLRDIEHGPVVQLPKLHPEQDKIARDRHRFKVVCCGRRWGKTLLGGVLAFITAARRGRVMWVAPTVKQANEGWAYLTWLARQTPGCRIHLAIQRISFSGGGFIEMRTEGGDPDNLRGAGLDGVVCDEAALLLSRSWSQVLRPALADKQGWALFISTPQHFNWFYKLFEQGQDPDDKDWVSWQQPSWNNPFLAESEIEDLRKEMTDEDFEQEIGASFTVVGGAILKELAANRPRYLRPMPSGLAVARTGVGMDWGTTFAHRAGVVCMSRLRAGATWTRSSWLSPSGSDTEWLGEAHRCMRDYEADVARYDRSQGSIHDRLEDLGFDAAPGVAVVEARIGAMLGALKQNAWFFDRNGPGMVEYYDHLVNYHRYPQDHIKAGKVVEEDDDDVDSGGYILIELAQFMPLDRPVERTRTFTYKPRPGSRRTA